MKLVGCMAARNEDWVLGLSARVALRWCDSLVILDHASTDRTPEIVSELVNEYGRRVLPMWVPNPKWDEMEHRQLMLEVARRERATHIAIIDADEVLTGNLITTDIARGKRAAVIQSCRDIPTGHILLQLPLYNLRGGLTRYHANGLWGQRWVSVAFADSPELHWTGDRFHHREPFGVQLQQYRPIAQGQGGVMHLWGADERRLNAKHRAYRITEALRFPHKSHSEIEAMYSMATEGIPPHDTPATWQFSETPASWWEPYADLMKYLDLDATPWQDAWCDEMIASFGMERFAGLKV